MKEGYESTAFIKPPGQGQMDEQWLNKVWTIISRKCFKQWVVPV